MKENTVEHMVCSYELKYPEPWEKELIAGAVDLVNHFSNIGLMLPTDIGHYSDLAYKGTLLIAKTSQNKVIGTVAITQFYEKGVFEFGGWAVSEYYQGHGIGVKLAMKLLTEFKHLDIIAFGNKNSGPILEAMGATVISDHSGLPKKAFELCANCPKKPAVGCCDTIYSLDSIIIDWAGKKNSHIKVNPWHNRWTTLS